MGDGINDLGEKRPRFLEPWTFAEHKALRVSA